MSFLYYFHNKKSMKSAGEVEQMKDKALWCLGLVLGAGVIVTDRFLHLLPDWLAIALFVIAWVLIVAGIWKERAKKL